MCIDFNCELDGNQTFQKFIKAFKSIVRITKGKNIILSSGDSTLSRNPYDIANMFVFYKNLILMIRAAFIGLDHAVGKLMISTHCRNAFMHGGLIMFDNWLIFQKSKEELLKAL